MTYQEANRIDADAVEKAAEFVEDRAYRAMIASDFPVTPDAIRGYVRRKGAGGDFGGPYIREDLLERVADLAISIYRHYYGNFEFQ